MAGKKKAKAAPRKKAAKKAPPANKAFGDLLEYHQGKFLTHSPVTGNPRKTPLGGAK